MKKKIIVAVLLLALALTALVGCSQTAEEFYRDLDKSIAETAGKLDEAYGILSGLTTYRYTTEVYLESMSNYDAVNKKFPDEKEWYKPSFGYEFVRDGNAEYVKITAEDTTYEFWYDGGALSQTKVDGAVVAEIPADKIAGLVDEIPVLSLVAAHAKGITVFREVSELRVKESNRLAAIIEGLSLLGVDAWEDGNDLYIEGNPNLKNTSHMFFTAHDDHRLAMTWALVGLCGNKPVIIPDFSSVTISYPNFLSDVMRLGK